MPEAMPLMGKMLQFGVRKFRTGRDLESAIDTFIERMEKKAQKLMDNPPPTPDQIKMQIAQAQQQSEDKRMQSEIQAQKQNDAASMQLHQMEAQQEQKQTMLEFQKESELAKIEGQLKMAETQAKLREIERKEQLDVQKHLREMQKLAMQDHVAQNAPKKESSNG
jgi:uncharacterized protein YneF (UPF0154 family)